MAEQIYLPIPDQIGWTNIKTVTLDLFLLHFTYMSSTSTYLNFSRNTEEAFEFYRSIFGWEFEWKINRFSEMPPSPGYPPLDEWDKDLIMHISLPILGGHKLMGTDQAGSMRFDLKPWNNVYICLHPDSLDEANTLFDGLSVGATIEMPLQKMFWWDYYWTLKDQFWVQWMINCGTK